MPSFEWITHDWASLIDGFGNRKMISLEDFRGLSGLDEDADWMSLAQEWGRKQSPVIDVGVIGQDSETVTLRKRP